MILTVEDLKQLATLCTRGDDGVHFMTRYDTGWLLSMENAGYITITRPVHEPTGLPYSEEYWSVARGVDPADEGIYRAAVFTDATGQSETCLTGPEHAGLPDDDLIAEAMTVAHRADLIGDDWPRVTEAALRAGLAIVVWTETN